MTIRIAILPYGPSDSAAALRAALRETIQNDRLDASVTLLRSENSMFRARPTDVVINYGNRRNPASFFGSATVLNGLTALNLAANKLQAFNAMRAAGVPTVEYTTQQTQAQQWVDNGDTVYARAVLNGHSGEGITVHQGGANNNHTVGAAPLYTKGITTQRREWRVHVFEGKITYVQLKRRRDGYREDPNYREDVRNHHTGWVYTTANITPSDAVLRAAFDAVQSLGLNFGAVDIISRQNDAWVLEVNTAPGLTGTTLETYQHNMIEYAKHVVLGTDPRYIVAYEVPAARPVAPAPVVEEAADETFALQAEPVQQEASVAPAAPVSMPQTQHESVNSTNGNTDVQRERGFYLADLSSAHGNGSAIARNVIMFFTNGRWFRHGWNLPIRRNEISNIRRITEVSTEAGSITL